LSRIILLSYEKLLIIRFSSVNTNKECFLRENSG